MGPGSRAAGITELLRSGATTDRRCRWSATSCAAWRGPASTLPPGGTMRATDLVHQAQLRVASGKDPGWQGRAHFFGAAANAMRNILFDQARRHHGQRPDRSRNEPLPTDVPELEHELSWHERVLRRAERAAASR